jgi:hypothetical protein
MTSWPDHLPSGNQKRFKRWLVSFSGWIEGNPCYKGGHVSVNKKQKILTIVALAVFSAIIFLHYHSLDLHDPPYVISNSYPPEIEDVRMPLFILAVFYTGLFFLLSEKKLSG